MNIDLERRMVQELIDMNPTTLTVRRQRYEDRDGERVKVGTPVLIGTPTVRLYAPKDRRMNKEGGVGSIVEWRALARYDADLCVGDTVSALGMEWIVTNVWTVPYGPQPVQKQVYLERIQP